jgi:hypothetical protein
MGLFDKKYCDVCGEKIGVLGNRKLEDGNLCKDCAKKLSPFFSERKSSTVDEIKQQLKYREENENLLRNFRPNVTIGDVRIDTNAGTFIVCKSSDFRKFNPDLISFSQVTDVNTDISEDRDEIYYKDEQGNNRSYDPPRYEYKYSFFISIYVNSPWFSEIKFELTDFNSRPDSRYTDLYREYERQAYDLTNILTGRGLGGMNNGYGNYNGNAYTMPQNGNMGFGAAFGAAQYNMPQNMNQGGFSSQNMNQGGYTPQNVQNMNQGGYTPQNVQNMNQGGYAPQNVQNMNQGGEINAAGGVWYCPNCGAENTSGFCQNCGTKKP